MDVDLVHVLNQQNSLPALYWYLAGVIQVKSNLSLQIIQNFLIKVEGQMNNYNISTPSKHKILNMLKSGQMAEANSFLEVNIKIIQNSVQMLEKELLSMIGKFREDPLYSKPIELKLEQMPSFSCMACNKGVFSHDILFLEECPHSFHKNCLAEHVQVLIARQDRNLVCPAQGCSKNIGVHELNGLVSQNLIEVYNNYCFQYMVSSGVLGNMMQCPKCKEKFSYEGNNIVCPICSVKICEKCFKSDEVCSCNDPIFRKQCPGCGNWAEKGEGYSNCVMCKYQFCFRCLKRPNECRCRL